MLLAGLDLSAAFCSVDHSTLATVLENMYGISGLALERFKDYLRISVVQALVRNGLSEAVSIPFSVHQGSCTGPVLHNVNSGTLGKLTQGYSVNILVYADDKTL